MDTSVEVKKGLTGSTLKLIAIITMFIDHIGAFLIEPILFNANPYMTKPILWGLTLTQLKTLDTTLRLIGRLAFPLFTFLLVEGFLHTRSKKNYLIRLSLFALISEIPFDLARSRIIFDFSYQNVFFTLALGLAVLWLMQKYTDTLWKWLIPVAGMLLATFLKTDYSWYGIGLIVIHEFTRNLKIEGQIILALWLSAQYTAVFALLPIHFYNGQRGLSLRYLFYWFYPVHLLFFYVLFKNL
jgi:hypothetical protein